MDNANEQPMQYRRRDVLRVCSRYYPKTPRQERMLIVACVAERFGVTVDQIMSDTRKQPIAAARQAAMRAIWVKYGDSTPVIGRMFNRDHTTVMHALGKINKPRAVYSGDNAPADIATA